jgi:hypothetical protein
MKVDEVRSAAGDAPGCTPHSQETRDEQEKKSPGHRNRRARGIAPASRSKTSVKRHHVHSRTNGQDRAASPDAAVPAPDGQGSAASVDASGASVASAAASAAAGADRAACAEAAHAPNGRARSRRAKAGPRPRVPGDAKARRVTRRSARSSAEREKVSLGRGETPLPVDSAGFVDAIHARVNLLEVGENLLRSNDEKVLQRAFERMLDIKFGRGAAAVVADAPTVIWDVPGVNLNRNEG